MAKSIEKQLAESTAASARNTADMYPNDKRMQEIAKQYEQRAKDTK